MTEGYKLSRLCDFPSTRMSPSSPRLFDTLSHSRPLVWVDPPATHNVYRVMAISTIWTSTHTGASTLTPYSNTFSLCFRFNFTTIRLIFAFTAHCLTTHDVDRVIKSMGLTYTATSTSTSYSISFSLCFKFHLATSNASCRDWHVSRKG